MTQAQTQPESVGETLRRTISEASQTPEERVEAWGAYHPDFPQLRKFMHRLAERDAAQMREGKPSTTGSIKNGMVDLNRLIEHARVADQIMSEERQALDKGRHTPNSLVDRNGVLNLDRLSQEARARILRGKAEKPDAKPESKGGSPLRDSLRRALAEHERNAAAHTSKER